MTTMISKTVAAIAFVIMTAGCAMAAPAPVPVSAAHAPTPRVAAPAPAPAPRAAAPAPAPAPAAPATVVVTSEPERIDGLDALVIGAGIAVGNALTDAVLGE